MDFVSDSPANGRRIKCLPVADGFGHECVQIVTDFGISGEYVTRLLDEPARFRGYPHVVRTDNGPEFTSRAFMAWAHTHGFRHILIEPGRPMQNGYIESFNGKFRDECLNDHWFQTLAQARAAIATWRQDFNEVRPHSSLGRIPPARFAQQHRQRAGEVIGGNMVIGPSGIGECFDASRLRSLSTIQTDRDEDGCLAYRRIEDRQPVPEDSCFAPSLRGALEELFGVSTQPARSGRRRPTAKLAAPDRRNPQAAQAAAALRESDARDGARAPLSARHPHRTRTPALATKGLREAFRLTKRLRGTQRKKTEW